MNADQLRQKRLLAHVARLQSQPDGTLRHFAAKSKSANKRNAAKWLLWSRGHGDPVAGAHILADLNCPEANL